MPSIKKFRAYSKEYGEYIDDVFADGQEWLEAHDYDCVHISEIFSGDEFVIEQYTGLKDKNGVEIYEGDILLVRCPVTNDYIVKVEFDYAGFEPFITPVGDYGIFLTDEFVEVIGNVNENKELLG